MAWPHPPRGSYPIAMTHSLFPDDSAPAITGLVLTASEAPLSKEQKAFNNLLAKLDKARRKLAGSGSRSG